MDILETVAQKRWPRAEVQRYQRMLYRGEVKRSKFSRFLHFLNYVLIIGVLILGNLTLSFVLFPLFLIADELFTAFFLITFGVLFGLFSDMLIYHIEGASDNYYAIIAGFLPIIVLGVFLIASFGANFWAGVLRLPQGMHSPVFVAVVYSVSYVLPFFYHVSQRYSKSSPRVR